MRLTFDDGYEWAILREGHTAATRLAVILAELAAKARVAKDEALADTLEKEHSFTLDTVVMFANLEDAHARMQQAMEQARKGQV